MAAKSTNKPSERVSTVRLNSGQWETVIEALKRLSVGYNDQARGAEKNKNIERAKKLRKQAEEVDYLARQIGERTK